MPKKPSGGRGKRESYSTSVMRVPDPIKPQVMELIEGFHQNRISDDFLPVTSLPQQKPVTGLPYQIPISVVASLLATEAPVGNADDQPGIMCGYPQDLWTDEWDENWEKLERSQVEQFNQLADQVNRCIWQIDNTFAIAAPGDGYGALKQLSEYRLIQRIDSKPATARQLLDWVLDYDFRMDNVPEIAREAIAKNRFDILTALEIGRHQPVNRRNYWHQKYKEQLACTAVNYWQWRDNPESWEICPELTNLLSLPEPPIDTCRVLECLAEGKDPFFKPEVKFNASFLDFGTYLQMGKLGNCEPEVKQAYRQAFIQWHLSALAQLGEDLLKSIYKVVYGCGWQLIEDIINPMSGEWWEVLGVSRDASAREVKAALKRLAKVWHPDVNPSPFAGERMTRINQAFEQFEKTCNRIR